MKKFDIKTKTVEITYNGDTMLGQKLPISLLTGEQAPNEMKWNGIDCPWSQKAYGTRKYIKMV